jgi:hypothetical protein
MYRWPVAVKHDENRGGTKTIQILYHYHNSVSAAQMQSSIGPGATDTSIVIRIPKKGNLGLILFRTP